MIALLLLYAVTGLAAFTSGRRLGRGALALAAVAPVATLAYLGVHLPGMLDGEVLTEEVRWVPELGISGAFRLDGFGMLMALIIAGSALPWWRTRPATSVRIPQASPAWPGC